MLATIQILSDHPQAQDYTIGAQGVLAGSHFECEWQLPEEPDHLFAVRVNEGQYLITNCDHEPMQLGGKVLPMQGTRVWKAGQKLVTASGSEYRLRLTRNAPARKAPTKPTVLPSTEETTPSNTTWKIICGVGGVFLLLLFASASNNRSTVDASQEFETVLNSFVNEFPNPTPQLNRTREVFQLARRAELRNNLTAALAGYLYVRETLEARRASTPGAQFQTQAEERMYRYTIARVSFYSQRLSPQ